MKKMHTLTLFTHRTCYSKLEAPKRIQGALGGLRAVRFEDKDLAVHSKEAKKAGVQMSPTLLLDGKILCVGIPEEAELKAMIQERLRDQ